MKWQGLTPEAVLASRKKYGNNSLTQLPQEALWKKILKGFKDPMIMILLVALVIQVGLYFMGQSEWYEPFGIFMAICIANGMAAIGEYKQESKAFALKAEEDAGELTKVVRDGVLHNLHVSEVVVGDIVYLEPGDKLPADGEILEGRLMVDQATLNGETEEAEKVPPLEGCGYDIENLLNKYYAYRGTVVCGGEGYLEVAVVGDATLFGKLALEVQEQTRITPLQVKLEKLAQQISAFGYFGAVLIVAGILIKTLFSDNLPQGFFAWLRLLIDAVTVAVTVIVCAVPEGLPMLTSMLMSLQSFRMAKDNVLVRKIKGLETAGSLSILFSDKTGTITEGKLSVVELVTGGRFRYCNLQEVSAKLAEEIKVGIGTNNSSFAGVGEIVGGNSTDRALMEYLVQGSPEKTYVKEEILHFEAFDSVKKFSTVVVRRGGNKTSYIKGAPEKIVEKCSLFLDENGQVQPLADKQPLLQYLDGQAEKSMRLIAVASSEGILEVGAWTLIGIVSIRDNVREQVKKAIQEVQQAGIQVVMVTGDRKETAAAIAREAGLVLSEDSLILSSDQLKEFTDSQLKECLPRLCVVARALPTDKSRLVRVAQELDLVVGMTGDGVNDSPALKKADVGFAMGSGTEVAKEAGDITILDDNFASIAKAILYGRTMFKCIRKFLIFQLTVNVAAVLTCFLGPLLGENVVLTVIQLLLINLAMDTLAAMAYGNEPALQEFMLDKPVARNAHIVTRKMLTEVVLSALYITALCLGILFWQPLRGLFGNVDTVYLKSALFATFMMAITFNGFNARTEHINVFEGLGRNISFLTIMSSIMGMAIVFVSFGGEMLNVESLSLWHWLLCAGLAFLVIPFDILRKLLL